MASYGFDVETIIPSNTPNSHNPDLVMLGTIWEMKAPTTTNENTLKTHFQKAKRQSGGKGVFDLTNIRGDTAEARECILDLFATTREMRRIMIIDKDARNGDKGDKLLDIMK